jgi:hypothetical protein
VLRVADGSDHRALQDSSSAVTWLAFALAVLEGLLGGFPVLHALLAPAFFRWVVVAVLMTSEKWNSELRPMHSSWQPPRSFAIAVPVIVVPRWRTKDAEIGPKYRLSKLSG